MAYLSGLPVDELKVDRTFVGRLRAGGTEAVIVRSAIELGHDLGLRVVAEGVEDEATWQELRRLGCDAAQGSWLARPVPAAELGAWLEQPAGQPTGSVR